MPPPCVAGPGQRQGAVLKGFFSGLLWGGVLGAIGLVIVSQITLMPAPAPEAPVPALPADLAQPEGTVAAPALPEPQPDEQAGTGEQPVSPLADPAVPSQPDETPAEVAEAVQVPPGSEFNRALPDEAPMLPSIEPAPAPAMTPKVDAPGQAGARPDTNTEPGSAPAPILLSPEAGAAPETAVARVAVPDPQLGIAPQAAAPVPDAPVVEPVPDMADLPPPPPLTPEEQALANPALETLPDGPAEPETATLPLEPVLQPVEPLTDADGNPISGQAASAANRPATGFSGAADGVVTGRLPRIGDAPETAAAAATDPALLDPIDRYARAFSNPQGKPVFAIVLIDRGDPGLDRAALAALPFPVTFALDPTLPDVARVAEAYIAAGQEVAMLATAIPSGATAADLEVTFGAHDAALPQAVAVLDLAEGGFQGNRPLATQVIPIIQGQGRGLLTYDAGLNAADQVARRDQLRAGTIFRRIDPEGQPASDIRRVLDRAAFKAAQDGRVAVVGEASPATVAALLEWTVEGRAAAVALAPATAVMVAR
jgi:polysaccharide deacetylase 2 family uncharacterized protein YibQ